jgi:predicted RNA-binding Zn-ribbon protein involved in translation (DUF1610 family)
MSREFVCPECGNNELSVEFRADACMFIEDGVPMVDEGTTTITHLDSFYCPNCGWHTFYESDITDNMQEV